MKLFLQSALEHLDRLERRVHHEIQVTRDFIQLLHDCKLDDTMEDSSECDSAIDSQAVFDDLNAIFNNVIPASFADLEKRLFMLHPMSPVTSFGATGLLSEGTSTPFGQPSEGPSTDGTSSSAIYGPVAQPQLDCDMEDSTESMYDGSVAIETPRNLSIDNLCVPSKENLVIEPGVVATRIRPRRDGFPRQVFDARDISCLSSPTACLNDVCINGCAALLYSQFKLPTVDCAILSTFDLPRIRYNALDEIIWRNASWTSYWEKNVWILPIHRPSIVGHWVICIIYFQTKEIHLFDSLAESWECDIKDIMKLIERFLTIARQRHSGVEIDLDGWKTRAINAKPCQSNTYDCGLWVLAAMTAVLRGRHVTNLQEEQMSDWRHYICSMVLSLPART